MQAQVIEATDLLSLLWREEEREGNDYSRWMQQPFVFSSSSSFSFGLEQSHGGPCGVLAVVQAEMLCFRLFEAHKCQETPTEDLLTQPLTTEERHALLSRALASILWRCRHENVHLVWLQDDTYVQLSIKAASADDPMLLEAIEAHILHFCGDLHGVMNFTLSVLATKTPQFLRNEMDDPTSCLIGAFGHCTQELVNLLLSGRAVSNVFDGNMSMGGGLELQGIEKRNRIGYLTQLESLRYCQVGTYYKSPWFPIWIIGSTSHFSVLFALEMEIVQESTAQTLLQRVQRVFKSLDPMETGFLEIGNLTESLRQLSVAPAILEDEYALAQLASRLEVGSGAGIVLWDEYWKVVSVLVHTSDLELALSGNYSAVNDTSSRPRSDSDLARELQAQFDAEQTGGSSSSIPLEATRPTTAQQTYSLFFYNGLKTTAAASSRPPLTKFVLQTTVPSDSCIGQSVPLNQTTSDGHQAGPALEAVLRTKWHDAQLNWQGQTVPSID